MRVRLSVRDADGVVSEIYCEGTSYDAAVAAADALVSGRQILTIHTDE